MKAIKVNKFLMPLLVVAALLGSVWIAKAAGVWQTSGRGQVLLDESGQADPLGIKGWMTLADVSETYGVPLDAVYVMIGAVPDVPATTALKDLERLVPDMEVSAIRAGVVAYREGSWKPADGRYGYGGTTQGDNDGSSIPEPAATPEAAEEHVPQGSGDGTGPKLALPADGSSLPGSEIKGRMTLREVVDLCQVPLDYLIAELGLPEDVDTQLRMRDLANQLGIEVLTVREVVDRYQAEH
jgi:hypothetical protein